MRPRLAFTLLFFLQILTVCAQVQSVKGASSSNASGGGSRDKGGSSSSVGMAYFVADVINVLGSWQQRKLKKKELNPSMISVDILAQAATQPSQYYLANPRVRGTWGLFSTDFRLNYLLQETANGTEDLSSFDWQVLQLNIITTRHVMGRVGGGFMKENFGGRKSFFESTYGLLLQSNSKKIGGNIEYRLAQDFDTGVVARRELSLQFEKRISSRGYWNTYVTFGGVYQRYYESITVWGLQAGIAFRIFSPPIHHEP